jgi:hypothetical protein
VNGSLLEKSKPLPDFYYETLAREAEMPRPQLSKASAVSYCKIQLDILTRLAGRTGRKIQRPTVRMIRTVHIDCQICLSVKNPASPNSTPGTVPGFPNKIELSMDKLEEVNGGFAYLCPDCKEIFWVNED